MTFVSVHIYCVTKMYGHAVIKYKHLRVTVSLSVCMVLCMCMYLADCMGVKYFLAFYFSQTYGCFILNVVS